MDKKATARRVANQWFETSTRAMTINAHRLRMQELDVALATSFRDQIIKTIRAKSQQVCSEASVQTHIDGDKTLHFQVSTVPGKHPQTLFVVDIPPAIFYQYAFQKGSTPSITEGYSGEVIDCPSLNQATTTSQASELILARLKKYLDDGGPEKTRFSGIPSPIEK